MDRDLPFGGPLAVIRHRVMRGTLSNIIGKLIVLGGGFLLTPFVLQRLGTADYGLWLLVTSVVGYGALLDVGIGGAVTKYVAEFEARGEHAEAHALVATALVLYTLLGVAVIGASVALASVFPAWFNLPIEQRATSASLVLLAGVSVGLSLPNMLVLSVLQGLHRFDILNSITSIGTMLSLATTVAVLLCGGGVVAVVALSIPLVLATQIAGVVAIRRVAPELRFSPLGADLRLIRKIASFGSSLFVMDVAGRLQSRSDEVVIGAFLPITSIAPYALAHKLSDIAHVLTDQFMRVLLPLASELHAVDDRRRLRALYLTSTRMSLALFLPMGIALAALAGPLLNLWVGPSLSIAAPLVGILMLASLVATSQWPAGAILQGMARHRFLAVTSTGAGLATVALSVAFVQPLGLNGVALALVVATSVESLGLVLPYTLKVLGVSGTDYAREVLAPTLLPAVPSAVVAFGLTYAFDVSSWPAIVGVAAAGGLVYVAVYFSSAGSASERQLCLGYARRTLVTAQARLGNESYSR
jgi:O-antigen/teichoic acid export membrane protein